VQPKVTASLEVCQVSGYERKNNQDRQNEVLILHSIANNGLFAGGGIIGCFLVPTLLDKCGRRLAIQITTVVCIVSAVLQVASVHVAMLLIGRFINGIGIGMIDVAVPIYQSEISPARVRGRMVGSHGFLVVCGYVSSSFFSVLSST
jgi:MFS family permease